MMKTLRRITVSLTIATAASLFILLNTTNPAAARCAYCTIPGSPGCWYSCKSTTVCNCSRCTTDIESCTCTHGYNWCYSTCSDEGPISCGL
jgi:hypothetical protein